MGLAAATLISTALLVFFGTGLAPIAALTWLVPLPALLFAPRVSTKMALSVAFLGYLIGTTNSWANYAHNVDVPLPAGIGISIGYSITFALTVFTFLIWVRRERPLMATLTAPAVWVGVLYLVSIVNPTGISGTLAGTQAAFPVVWQTASVTGAWGVEYLLMLAPTAIAALIVTPKRIPVAAVVVTVFALVFGLGAWRLSYMDSQPERTVALVVRNRAGWGVDVTTAQGRDLLASYSERIAALPDGVRSVVLPEGSFKVDDASLPALRDPLAQLARRRGIDLVVGYVRVSQGRKFNEALAIPAGGGEPVVYLKHHDTVSPLGDKLVTLADAGVVICMDVNFPDPSRDYASAGARLLLIPASDNNEDGWQHARTGVLRGVENGMAVAWAGRNGTLTLADGSGRIRAEQHTGDNSDFTVVVANLRPGTGPTPYTRFGDWFAWSCLALIIASLALTLTRRRDRMKNERSFALSPGGQPWPAEQSSPQSVSPLG